MTDAAAIAAKKQQEEAHRQRLRSERVEFESGEGAARQTISRNAVAGFDPYVPFEQKSRNKAAKKQADREAWEESVHQRIEEELQTEVDALREQLSNLQGDIDAQNNKHQELVQQGETIRGVTAEIELRNVTLDTKYAAAKELEAFLRRLGDLDFIESELNKTEDLIANDSLQHVWQDTVKRDDVTQVDLVALIVEKLPERIASALSNHEHCVHRANELNMKADQEKAIAELAVTESIQTLNTAYEAEKRDLMKTRAQLKTLETEQHFHIRRGTYIKDPPPTLLRDVDVEKQLDVHSQTCAEIVDERERLELLTDDVRELRKECDIARKSADDDREKMQAEIRKAKSAAEEKEWERELLFIEREDLAAVKKELIAVTAAVKQQRKH